VLFGYLPHEDGCFSIVKINPTTSVYQLSQGNSAQSCTASLKDAPSVAIGENLGQRQGGVLGLNAERESTIERAIDPRRTGRPPAQVITFRISK
jgi:hypothetical protein